MPLVRMFRTIYCRADGWGGRGGQWDFNGRLVFMSVSKIALGNIVEGLLDGCL